MTISIRPIISESTGLTDLRHISRVGRNAALDDESEICFSTPQGTLPWQPIFAGLMHTNDFASHSVDGVSVR